MSAEIISDLEAHARWLRRWLFDAALPLWLQNGADGAHGGFAESLGPSGRPTDADRRARVQPRQVHAFGEAAMLGWAGDAGWAMRHALGFFDQVYRRGDGLYATLATARGVLVDRRADLYDQAFALLAFAQTARVEPRQFDIMQRRAEDLMAAVRSRFGHASRGFEEDVPRRLPLRANPHMHMLEAALAWEAATLGQRSGTWTDLADEIATLCLERFIDPATGALTEFFDAEWLPTGTAVVEPGHQFEWAWLLSRWAVLRDHRLALATARRLYAIGLEHGVCAQRKVAVMALDGGLAILDPVARLWSQTEWLKAALYLASLSPPDARPSYLQSAADACVALRRFLDVPTHGLWRDRMLGDGSFIDEPSPASSLYHIVGAISELERHVGMPAPLNHRVETAARQRS